MPAPTIDPDIPLETWEGMDFDPATGEAIVNSLHTQWYFETNVSQSLPAAENMEGRAPQRVTPWGWLRELSCYRLIDEIRPYAPLGVSKMIVGEAENNERFPYSKRQREILITANGNVYRQPAGALASAIARTTFYDPIKKEVIQSPKMVIEGAMEELRQAMVEKESQQG